MNVFAAVKYRLLVLLCVSLVGLSGMVAKAEESPRISVAGTGVAEAMPDTMELAATVSGNSELAGDAVEKFRGNKRRVVDALKGLGIQGLSVVGSGLSINSGTPPNPLAALQGGQANQAKASDKLVVQERLTVTLSGIDKMNPDDLLQLVTRIVDVAKDAGVVMGPAPKGLLAMQFSGAQPEALVHFKLSDPAALRKQAYAAALKQARAKAEHLAQLAGLKLGDIVSIRESSPVAKKQEGNDGAMAAYLALMSGAAGSQSEHAAGEFHSIPVSVSLSVQFEIVGKE